MTRAMTRMTRLLFSQPYALYVAQTWMVRAESETLHGARRVGVYGLLALALAFVLMVCALRRGDREGAGE